MASHLTVTSPAGLGIGSSRSLNGHVNVGLDAKAEGPNAFAALLGLVGLGANTNTAAAAPLAGDVLAGVAIGADAQGSGQHGGEHPDAIAAALNAIIPFDAGVTLSAEAKPLLDGLLASLGDLKAQIEAGQPLDTGLLGELNEQLDALGAALGINLSQMPTLTDLTALLDTPLTEEASLATQLSAGLAPLANLLLGAHVDVAADAAPLAQGVGEKLAALLGALEGEQISGDVLTELGLAADAEVDADLEAAIAKLLAAAPKPEVAVAAPVLAKPALQLSEPVLTGKTQGETTLPTEATADASAGVEPIASAEAGQTGSDKPDERGPDPKPAEAKPAGTATVEAKTDTQPPGLPQQASARAEAVAGLRVVQAGYQTSQQQLNLPQIAFELARQTTEGNTRFQIRLDPAELGRIDVQLDIDTSGQVNARLVVEKAETLDLMQRDQRGLEKALHQAGLDSAKTNLEFSLKQNQGGDTGQHGRNGNGRQGLVGDGMAEAAEAPPTINLYRASLSASGINIIA